MANNNATRQQGRVKKWFAGKGFGFIARKEERDLFVHVTALSAELRRLADGGQLEGTEVTFTVTKGSKGLAAAGVEWARQPVARRAEATAAPEPKPAPADPWLARADSVPAAWVGRAVVEVFDDEKRRNRVGFGRLTGLDPVTVDEAWDDPAAVGNWNISYPRAVWVRLTGAAAPALPPVGRWEFRELPDPLPEGPALFLQPLGEELRIPGVFGDKERAIIRSLGIREVTFDVIGVVGDVRWPDASGRRVASAYVGATRPSGGGFQKQAGRVVENPTLLADHLPLLPKVLLIFGNGAWAGSRWIEPYGEQFDPLVEAFKAWTRQPDVVVELLREPIIEGGQVFVARVDGHLRTVGYAPTRGEGGLTGEQQTLVANLLMARGEGLEVAVRYAEGAAERLRLANIRVVVEEEVN